MEQKDTSLKEAVIRLLNELPPEQIVEVLDFATFIKERSEKEDLLSRLVIKTLPVSQLDELVGLIALGGDALGDTEHLYDE